MSQSIYLLSAKLTSHNIATTTYPPRKRLVHVTLDDVPAALSSNFVNPLAPRVKSWVLQYLTVLPFVFQLSPVCNVGKLIHFGLGTVESKRFSLFSF